MPVTFSPSALSEARRRLYGANAGQSTSRATQLARIERDAYEQQARANKAAADAEQKAIEDAAKQADDERKLANAQRTNELLAQGRRYHLDRVTGEPRPLQSDEEFAAAKAEKGRKLQEAEAKKKEEARQKTELDKVTADEAVLRENEKSIQRNQQREELEREEKRRKLKGIQEEYEKRLKAADDLELDLTPEQRQATVGTIENVKKRLADLDTAKFEKQKESLKFDTAQDEREALLRKREAAIKRGEAPTPSPEPLIADPVEFEQSAAQHEQEVQQFNAEQAQQQAKFDALEAENERLMSLPHSAADVSTDGKWHKDVIPQINALNQAMQSRSPEWQAKQQRIQEQAKVLNESATAINAQAKAANEQAKAEQAAAREAAYQDFEKVAPGMGKEYQAILDDSDKRADAIRTKYAGREDAPEAKAAFTALEQDITGKLDGLNAKIETTQKAKSDNLEKLWNQFGAGDFGTATMRDWVADKSTDPEYDKLGGVSSMPANFKAKVKEMGLDEKEARNYMETRRQLDWSSPLDPEKAEKSAELTRPLREKLGITDMLEPVRRLPNGAIIPNPVLGGDEEAFKKVIEAADGTPEQKAEAMKLWPSYRRQYGEGLLTAFAKQSAFGTDFNEWRDHLIEEDQKVGGKNGFAAMDAVDQALMYQEQMKGRSFFRRWADLIASNVTAGFMDVTQAVLGTTAALTGNIPVAGEGWSKLAAANAENAASLVNTQEQLSNTGLAGSIAGTIARMAPGVAATVATGSMAGGMIFGGAQTAGSLYGEAYNTLRNEGKSHMEAWKASAPASLAAGAMTAGLTKLFPGGVTALANNPEARASVRAMVAGFMSSGKAITKGALDEIPEEVIDEAMSQLAQGYAEGRNPDDVVRDFITGLPELVVASGLMGGGMQALKDRMDRRAGGLPPDIAPEAPEAPEATNPYAGPLPEERAAVQAAIAAFNPTAPESIQAMPAVIRTVPKGQESGINAKARAAMDAVAGIASGEITDSASLTETQMRALGVKLDKNRKLVPAGGANSPAPLIYTRTNKAGVDQIIITDEARDWLKGALPDLTIGQSEAERIQAINRPKPKPKPKQEMSGTRLRKLAQNRQNELTWKRDGKAGDAKTIATISRQLSKDEEAELEFLDKHLADNNTQAIADKYGVKLKSATTIISEPEAAATPAATPADPSEIHRKRNAERKSYIVRDADGDIDRQATKEKREAAAKAAGMTRDAWEDMQAALNVKANEDFFKALNKGDTVEWVDGNGNARTGRVEIQLDGSKVVRDTTEGNVAQDYLYTNLSGEFSMHADSLKVTPKQAKQPAPAPETAPKVQSGPSASEGAVEGASPDRQAKVAPTPGAAKAVATRPALGKAPPLQRKAIGKGMKGGSSYAEFATVDDADAFAYAAKLKAMQAKNVSPAKVKELGEAAKGIITRISKRLGISEQEARPVLSAYNVAVRTQAKAIREGESFYAPTLAEFMAGNENRPKAAQSNEKPAAVTIPSQTDTKADIPAAKTAPTAGETVINPGDTVTSDVYKSEGEIEIIGPEQPANKDHMSPWHKARTKGGRTFEIETRFINGHKPAKAAPAEVDTGLKTPEQWSKEKDVIILSADGWRSTYKLSAKDFNEPISEQEYLDRLSVSTIKPLKAGIDSLFPSPEISTDYKTTERPTPEYTIRQETGDALIQEAEKQFNAYIKKQKGPRKARAEKVRTIILKAIRKYNGHLPIRLMDGNMDMAFDRGAILINPTEAINRAVSDAAGDTDAEKESHAVLTARDLFYHEFIHRYVSTMIGDARVMDVWERLPEASKAAAERAYSLRVEARTGEAFRLSPRTGGHEYYRMMVELTLEGRMTEVTIGKGLAEKWQKILNDILAFLRDLERQFAGIPNESARKQLISDVQGDIKLVTDAIKAAKSISPDAEPAQATNAGAGSTSGKPVEGSSTTVANPVSINTEKESSGNDAAGWTVGDAATDANGNQFIVISPPNSQGFMQVMTEGGSTMPTNAKTMTKGEATVEAQEKALAQMVADHNARAAKFFFKNGKPRAGTPPEMTESMQAAGKRLEAWQKRLTFLKTPAVWRGKTRNGTPMLVLYRTGGGNFDVQIGPDKTSMEPAQVAKVSGMTRAEVDALPNDSTPPKKRERTDLDSPTVKIGDIIIDSQGSMGPVISFEGETPVMGMEGENEGDVEPQAAVGGWKLESPAPEVAKPTAEAPKAQEMDEGDAALGEAFAGLFASPTVKPLAQSDLPKDRRDAMMKAASTLIDLGLRKPEELAQRLDKLAPNGALRQYTRAFWRLMSGFDSTLEENPHWPTIYGELDQVSSRPPSVEGVIGAVPEQGAAPASGLISDEESARLDALTVNNKDRLDKLSANQLSQLNKELLRQPSSAKIDAILATEHPDDIKAALDVVTKSKADTPATAEAKVEEQVQVVAATEGQRDAKEIKKEIAEKLDAAIAAALENESPRAKELRTEIKGLEIAKKETTSAASSRNLTKQIGRLQKELDRETAVGTKSLTKGEIDGSIITIQIPGDGTFKVWNTAENLRNIRRRVSLIETDVKPDAPQRSEQDNRKQDAINLADGASERFGGPLAAIEWLKEQMSDSTDSVKEWYQSAIDILSKRKGDIAREEAEQSTPESESTSTAGVDESALNTPMMKQWRTLREPLDANTVLLVRLGDFYEAFGNDAKVLSEFAKVALTKRNGIPMAGIPHHSATSYIQKLVSAGKRVAIAEQVGDAKPGVPTEREVTSITPETKAEPATVADTEIIPPTSAQSTMMETLEAAVAKERAKTGDFNRAVYFHRLNGDPSVYVEKRNSTNQTADRDSLALARMDTEGKTSIMPRDEGRQVMAKIVEETASRDAAENARSKAAADKYRQSEYARTYRTSPSGIIVTRNSDGEWIERGTDRKLGRKKGDDSILSTLSGPNLALFEVVMEKSGGGIYWRGVNEAAEPESREEKPSDVQQEFMDSIKKDFTEFSATFRTSTGNVFDVIATKRTTNSQLTNRLAGMFSKLGKSDEVTEQARSFVDEWNRWHSITGNVSGREVMVRNAKDLAKSLPSAESRKVAPIQATPAAPKVSIPDLHAAFVTAKRQQGDTPRVSAVYAAAKSKNPDLTRQEFMQAVQSGVYAPLVTIQDGKMTLAPITDAEIMDAAENATETPETILEEWAATKEPLQSSPGGLSEAEVPIYENPKFLAAQEAEDTKEQNRIAAGYFRNFLDRVKSRGWQRGDTYHSAFSRAKIIKTGRSRISNSTYFTVLAEPTEQGPNAEVWADREGLSWDRDEDTGKLTVTFDVRVSDHEATDSAATHADIEFDVEKINSGDVSWLDLSDTFFPELNELVEEKYFGNPESSRADGVEEPLQASPTVRNEPFYSKLAQVIEQKMPNRADVATIKGLITNPQTGIKAEELKWSGILPWIEAQASPITKQAVLEYLATDGAVRLEEVRMGGKLGNRYDPELVRQINEVTRQMRIYREDAANVYGEDRSKWPTEVRNGPEITRLKNEHERLIRMRDDKAEVTDTKFSQHQLSGGENYREVVLAMPIARRGMSDAAAAYYETFVRRGGEPKWADLSEAQRLQIITETPAEAYNEPPEYTSSHFPDVPNYVAHMRVNDRTDAEGQAGTFIEEIQSDRHQAGRKKGYQGEVDYNDTFEIKYEPSNNQFIGDWVVIRKSTGKPISTQNTENEAIEYAKDWASKLDNIANARIPDAPFRTTWPLQMFKRALADAVAAGKQWIGWTTGETQAERFDLSKQVDSLNIRKQQDGLWSVIGIKGGSETVSQAGLSDSKLADTVGKELAEKAIADMPGMGYRVYSGDELKVGGQGMKGFYDTILPKEIGKYVKQWGAGVVNGEIEDLESLKKYVSSYSAWLEYVDPDALTSRDEFYAMSEADKLAAIPRDGDFKTTPIWRVDITPQMRTSVDAGQALFATPTVKEGDTGKKPRRNVANQASNLPGARDAWDKLSQTYEDKELETASYQKIEAAVDEVIAEQAGFDRLYNQIVGKMREGIVLSLEEDIARRMIARVLWIDGNDNPASRTKAKLLFMADMREASETARKLGSRVDKVETPQQRLDNAMRNILSPSSKTVRERLVNVWSGAEKLAAIKELKRRLASTQDTLQRERAQRELEKAQARKDQNEVMEELAREDDAKVDAILKRNGLTQTDLFLSVDDRFAMQEAILGLARVHLSQQSAAHKKAIEMSVRGYSDNAIAKETGLTVAEVSNTAEHFRNVVAKQLTAKEVGKGNTFSKFIQWGKRIISEMGGPLRASPTAPLGGMVAKGTPSAAAVAAQIQAILNASIPTKGQRNAMSLHAATAKGKNGQNVKVFVPYNPADWKQVYRVARELSTREATRLDKAYEYWINGILSGPQTHVVNTASNLLSTAWAYGPQWFSEATANVAIRNPNAPQFGEFRHVWAGFFKGIMPALRNFALAWDTEADPVEHQYLDKPVTVMFQGGNLDKVGGIRPSIGGTLGRYVRVPGRFLVAQDAFAKTLIMHAESAAMAYRLGKKQGLAGAALTNFMASQIATHGSESWQHAFEKAVELTFQDENDVTKAVEGVTNALKRAKFVGGLMRYLLPFVRTPTNIYRAGIRKAGGSAGMLLYRLGKSGYYAIKGDKNEFRSYREGAMVKDVSESVMATALWFIVMGMSEGDDDDNQKAIEITGSRPFGVANAGERASQLRQEGGSNLIIIRKNPLTGEKLDKPIQFAYGRYEPIALALSTLVDGAREFKEWTRFQPENRTTDKLAGSMMRHVLAQAKEKTFLQGVSGVLQFIEDAGSNNFSGKDILMKNLMNGAIPNLIRQPYRLSQDEIADAKKAESELSRSLGIGQPKVNEAGQPVQRGGNAVTRVLFPVASKPSTELFDAALKKWNTANPDQQWNPDPLTKADLYVYGPKVDGKMQQVPLKDPAKITKFEQEIGQKFSDYAGRKLMAAGWRPGKPVTPQMIDAIKEVRTNAIKSVRASMGREERFGIPTPATAPSSPPARPSPAPTMPVPSTPPRPVPMKDDAAERAKARLIEARKRLNYGGK